MEILLTPEPSAALLLTAGLLALALRQARTAVGLIAC
ncbi:MAG: PEP-CTERM sorting domain-containing protein [Deltaproteobacteria bacterium]|nr:PEP-CTERM sorting domain-containing protein [Deltaproteobacteria bacterium]